MGQCRSALAGPGRVLDIPVGLAQNGQYELLNAAHSATLGHVITRDPAVLGSWLTGLQLAEPGLAPLSVLLSRDEEPDQQDGPLRHVLAAAGYKP